MNRSIVKQTFFIVSIATSLGIASSALAENPVAARIDRTINAANVSLSDAVSNAMLLEPTLSVAEAKLGITDTTTNWAIVMTDGSTIDISRYSMVDGSQVFDKLLTFAPHSRREQNWVAGAASPVTVLDAINIAAAQEVGDRTYEVRYGSISDAQGTAQVWEARVITSDNLLVRYDIDANTGDVLYGTVIHDGRREEVNICSVKLNDALGIAATAMPDGTALGADFITRGARIYWSVWMQQDNQVMAVVINPIRGDVVSIEPATFHGHHSSDLADALAAGLPVSMSDAVDIARQNVGNGYSYFVMATGKPDHITYKVQVLEGSHHVATEMVDSQTGQVNTP